MHKTAEFAARLAAASILAGIVLLVVTAIGAF